ncbi:hypothetical protein CAL7102_00953 [Dulcicalothrix desertica PCC 7102]|nr:hypothetical protein CAL7102_00953 [Dulcicalothrix desertica PCC 7102]
MVKVARVYQKNPENPKKDLDLAREQKQQVEAMG